MHITLNSLLLVSAASLAAAGTLRHPSSPKRTFQINQARNSNFKGHSLGRSIAKAHRKYGIHHRGSKASGVKGSHPSAPSAPSLSTNDSALHAVTASSLDDLAEWVVPVSIGTPAQQLNLDIDTGSSDLWVMSSETVDPGQGHNLYDPSKSSSAKQMDGATWSITYGDGSQSSGDVFLDTFNVGGLVFAQQAIEVAKAATSEFTSSSLDGLIGLAYPVLNTVQPTKQNTFFDNVEPQLPEAVFVADLNANEPGAFYFGGIPSQVGEVYYGDVNQTSGFWMTTIRAESGQEFHAISDTGTTLALLPADVVTAYYANVPSAEFSDTYGGVVVDCSATLPDWSFSVGGGNITVSGDVISYAQLPGQTQLCMGGLQAIDAEFAILGDVVLRAAYGVFDRGNNRVGWGPKTTSSQPTKQAAPSRSSQTAKQAAPTQSTRPSQQGQQGRQGQQGQWSVEIQTPPHGLHGH